MKALPTLMAAGFMATAVQAGEQPVIYYTMNDVPGGADSTPITPVKTLTGIETGTASASPSGQTRVVAGQKGVVAGNDDAVYAALLKEAKKRGLR